MAERMGFEPMKPYWGLHDFQSCALDQLGHLSKRLLNYSRNISKSQEVLQRFFDKFQVVFFDASCISLTFAGRYDIIIKKRDNMGKFDGYLICSDWDGTLFVNGTVCERDKKAIAYFQENGGLFTVSSGRNPEFVLQFSDLVKPNTYLIGLNGAMILDKNGKDEFFRHTSGEEIINCILDFLNVAPFYKKIFLHAEIDGQPQTVAADIPDFLREIDKYKQMRYFKALVTTDVLEDAEKGRRIRDAFHSPDFELVASWIYSLEFCAKEYTKGAACLRLKEKTNSKVLVCAGNYENDFSMLDVADVAYVVGGSEDFVIKHADRVTCRAEEGALAYIIDEIERHVI